MYHIIIIFLLIVVIWLLIDQRHGDNIENFDVSEINNEALQSISSIYNDKTMTVDNLTVTDTITTKFSNIIPRGTVVAYAGTTPPPGWTVCDGSMATGLDGTNFRTPNLRSRFILGAGTGPGLTKRSWRARERYSGFGRTTQA